MRISDWSSDVCSSDLAGVEYGSWEGLTACSTSAAIGNAQDILNDIMATPLVRCDVPQWTLLGISLAGYNAILSLGAAIAIFALMFGRKGYIHDGAPPGVEKDRKRGGEGRSVSVRVELGGGRNIEK